MHSIEEQSSKGFNSTNKTTPRSHQLAKMFERSSQLQNNINALLGAVTEHITKANEIKRALDDAKARVESAQKNVFKAERNAQMAMDEVKSILCSPTLHLESDEQINDTQAQLNAMLKLLFDHPNDIQHSLFHARAKVTNARKHLDDMSRDAKDAIDDAQRLLNGEANVQRDVQTITDPNAADQAVVDTLTESKSKCKQEFSDVETQPELNASDEAPPNDRAAISGNQIGFKSEGIAGETCKGTKHDNSSNETPPNDFRTKSNDEYPTLMSTSMVIFPNKSPEERLAKKAQAIKRNNRFECDQCSYRTKFYSLLESHMWTHTGEKPFVCMHCEIGFTRKCSLQRHLQAAHAEKKPTTSIAKRLFREKFMKNFKENSVDAVFECDQCTYRTKKCSHFKAHMRVHTGETPYPCVLCEKRFTQEGNLNRHLQYVHTKKIAQDTKLLYPTVQLKTEDSHSGEDTEIKDVHRHSEASGDVAPSTLPKSSPKGTLHSNDTKRKMQVKKKFRCDRCSLRLKSSTRLAAHIKICHGSEALFECEVCQKKFTQKSNVQRHLKDIHGEDKSYNCDICGRLFSRKDSLERHMTLHQNGKTFKCFVCKTNFHSETSMCDHIMVTHKEAKIYPCDLCVYVARRASALKRHLTNARCRTFPKR